MPRVSNQSRPAKKSKGPKFEAGDPVGTAASPLAVRVPTYQGPDCDRVDFAAPLVPVTIENKCGIVLTLGSETEESYPPEVICERRKNGWLVALNINSDENMLVYVMDDNTVKYCKSGKYQDRPEEVEMPPKEVDELPERRTVTAPGRR